MEKTRQNLVKKENENEDKDLERAGQMLRKVKSDVYNVPVRLNVQYDLNTSTLIVLT